MPIEHGLDARSISKDEYHKIDYEVMRHAFAIHNEFGRLHDEAIYEQELGRRCAEAGFGVETQVPVVVRHGEFVKPYFLDMVIDRSVVYELKAVDAIVSRHRAQLLNYLMLVGLMHGKLANFRPPSVDHEFVTTRLSQARRMRFTIDDAGFRVTDEKSEWLRNFLGDLLSDWGAFLNASLYREAVMFFLGGEENACRPVSVLRDGTHIGTQKVDLLTAGTALRFTGLVKGITSYEKHLQRFLAHTSVKRIQWVNFNHHVVSVKTLGS